LIHFPQFTKTIRLILFQQQIHLQLLCYDLFKINFLAS